MKGLLSDPCIDRNLIIITLYRRCVDLSSDDLSGVRTLLKGDLRETER
jgi:hypothetical protein